MRWRLRESFPTLTPALFKAADHGCFSFSGDRSIGLSGFGGPHDGIPHSPFIQLPQHPKRRNGSNSPAPLPTQLGRSPRCTNPGARDRGWYQGTWESDAAARQRCARLVQWLRQLGAPGASGASAAWVVLVIHGHLSLRGSKG